MVSVHHEHSPSPGKEWSPILGCRNWQSSFEPIIYSSEMKTNRHTKSFIVQHLLVTSSDYSVWDHFIRHLFDSNSKSGYPFLLKANCNKTKTLMKRWPSFVEIWRNMKFCKLSFLRDQSIPCFFKNRFSKWALTTPRSIWTKSNTARAASNTRRRCEIPGQWTADVLHTLDLS